MCYPESDLLEALPELQAALSELPELKNNPHRAGLDKFLDHLASHTLRELQEEIGLGARRLESLRMFYVNPSHMFGPMYAFVARDLYPSVLKGDEPEPLEIVRVPLARLDELIDDDQFGDARTLAALMLLQRAIGTAK